MSTVTVWFAGKTPCKDCGCTTSVRGVSSITGEVSCANQRACYQRRRSTTSLNTDGEK